MEFNTIIDNRQSQRTYTGKQLTAAQLAAVLHAAEKAPVALGQFDRYHLTVIQDPEALQAIENGGAAVAHHHGGALLYGAPTFVLVSAQGDHIADYSSAAIIAHNMALAAVNEGVGYCYIWGAVAMLAQNAALCEQLQVPAGFTPVCGVTLGESPAAYGPRDTDPARIGITRL